PPVRMGRPHFAVLRDGMPQARFALVRLANHMECGAVAAGEPENGLVVARGSVAVPGPAVLVMPDDLAAIDELQLIQVGLQKAAVMVNRMDEQVAAVLQNALRLEQPDLAPREPLVAAAEKGARAEFAVLLQTVG